MDKIRNDVNDIAPPGGNTSNKKIVPNTKLWKTFKRVEVAELVTYEKCIIIINEFVYDVSAFLERHPGGDDIIIEYAGRDATSAFEGKGHSEQAYEMLESFKIGVIAEGD
jgi:cytochrome b5